MLPADLYSLCDRTIEHCANRHVNLQNKSSGVTHEQAIYEAEHLGAAAMSAADFALSILCAEDKLDEAMENRSIHNCRRAAVGILLSAIDMRAVAVAGVSDTVVLASHTNYVIEMCDTHGLDPEDCRRFMQLTESRCGEDNVRHLPRRSVE